MDIKRWLARCAACIARLRQPQVSDPLSRPDSLSRKRRLAAARSLATRLSAHLRRDIGADDG